MDFKKLRQEAVHLHRALGCLAVLYGGGVGCATLPEPKHEHFDFPKDVAFMGKPTRPHEVLGGVKSKISFQTLDPDAVGSSEKKLCRNYFNAAVHKLVEYAKAKGADAVMEVRSTVFFMDGTSKNFDRPECFDDGAEGQVLTQGIAIRFLPEIRPADPPANPTAIMERK